MSFVYAFSFRHVKQPIMLSHIILFECLLQSVDRKIEIKFVESTKNRPPCPCPVLFMPKLNQDSFCLGRRRNQLCNILCMLYKIALQACEDTNMVIAQQHIKLNIIGVFTCLKGNQKTISWWLSSAKSLLSLSSQLDMLCLK